MSAAKIKIATLEEWRAFIEGEPDGSMTREHLANGGSYVVDGVEWRPPPNYAREGGTRRLQAPASRVHVGDDRRGVLRRRSATGGGA